MLELSSKAVWAAVMIRRPLVIHPALRWSTSQRAAPSSLIPPKSREAARCGCGGMIPRAGITRLSHPQSRRPLTVHYPIHQSVMPMVSMTGSWSQTDINRNRDSRSIWSPLTDFRSLMLVLPARWRLAEWHSVQSSVGVAHLLCPPCKQSRKPRRRDQPVSRP